MQKIDQAFREYSGEERAERLLLYGFRPACVPSAAPVTRPITEVRRRRWRRSSPPPLATVIAAATVAPKVTMLLASADVEQWRAIAEQADPTRDRAILPPDCRPRLGKRCGSLPATRRVYRPVEVTNQLM